MVAKRGEYAVRGGILDVFPTTLDYPVRVEVWEFQGELNFALSDALPGLSPDILPGGYMWECPNLVYANPWEQWELVPITPWQSHLTPP